MSLIDESLFISDCIDSPAQDVQTSSNLLNDFNAIGYGLIPCIRWSHSDSELFNCCIHIAFLAFREVIVPTRKRIRFICMVVSLEEVESILLWWKARSARV